MKAFTNLKNNIYQHKTNGIMYHERVYKLQEDCSELGMFSNVNDCDPKVSNAGLTCFYEEKEKIGAITVKRTYYFFYGNTCIVYCKSGYDRIIRILAKSPEDDWNVYRENDVDGLYHLKISTKYAEVYDWWEVDWMKCGKCDSDGVIKSGNWWKSVYNDICGIYQAVASKSVDNVLNGMYAEYEKTKSHD